MRIEPTSIEFRENGTPFSPRFGDIYYSPLSGIDESSYVYLDGSGFIEALQNQRDRSSFVIGEIGFGVGMNFLLTLRHFLKHARPDQSLTYCSAEKYPVFQTDLVRLYDSIPELRTESSALLERYPVLTPGIHLLSFANHRVRLLLMLGEAKEMFQNLDLHAGQRVQHWYWDGFAPQKNEDAFDSELFKILAQKSCAGAQGASFTSAGWVRRGLESAGFKVEKRKGYAQKRECIRARLELEPSTQKFSPWFSSAGLDLLKPGQSVGVIGAGLSGTAIARSLAERGFSVTLVDPDGIATHASGNPVGLFNVQLSKKPNPISRFSQLSLVHFINEVRRHHLPTQKGITRLDAKQDPEGTREAMMNSEYPETFYQLTKEGMSFGECGILSPPTLCKQRSNHPKISLIQKRVMEVDSKDSRFTLKDESGSPIVTCDHLVYSPGASLSQSSSLSNRPGLVDLPVRAIRGQIIHVQPTPASAEIQETLVDAGYLTPICEAVSGMRAHCIGATYQAKTILPDQEERDRETLLNEARAKHPAFQDLKDEDWISSRVGFRLSTPDKLPLIGPLCEFEILKTLYHQGVRSGKTTQLPPLQARQREWVLLGMGSRGITFSSYGAELLASLMTGEPMPIETDLWEHLHSARFIIRSLKKPEAPHPKLG